MAHHHARLNAGLVEIGPDAQAQRLDAQVVDLRADDPACVVLAKPRRLDQRGDLIGKRVGDQIGARRWHRHEELRTVDVS